MKSKMKHLLRFWYVYLFIIASSVVATIYYCNFINRPKNEETINLFIASYTSKSEPIYDFLKEKSPGFLREINITLTNPKSADFGYFIVNKGLNKADIFILPESYLFDDLLNNQFALLNEETTSSYFNYTADSSNHGVLLHDVGGEDNNLLQFRSEQYEDEKFYIFYRVNSLHIGALNPDSKADTALLFTKYLLNSYE